jgi:hypothetical protein
MGKEVGTMQFRVQGEQIKEIKERKRKKMSVKKEKKYICIREDKKYMSMCKNKIK